MLQSSWYIHKNTSGDEDDIRIYCQLIPGWIESTRAQIFSRQTQSGDTEPNSKYSLKKYFQIV